MIWPALGWLWRHMGNLRWPIVWLVSPKYTVGVNAIIINRDGKVWLQQHRFWPDKAWGLPGGLVGANESPDDALRREIKEELKIELQEIRIFATERFYRRGVALCYVAKASDENIQLDDKELLDGRYFNVHSLPNPLLEYHRDLILLHNKLGD